MTTATPGGAGEGGAGSSPEGATYAFLDAGDGRRLERFGAVVLDRPAPGAASAQPGRPERWHEAAARFDRADGAAAGRWVASGTLPERWTIDVDGLTFELRPTPAGHVGLFPEHLPVARWAVARADAAAARSSRPALVLNLFAHTGLATLLLARAGAAVTHVDSSRPAVAWARRNAALSGLDERPIRWLVDDAGAFVGREARRGRRYDGVVLDPPSYGHGPRGRTWRLVDDLPTLLSGVRDLLAPAGWFVACTAHATGLRADDLADAVRAGLGPREMQLDVRQLALGEVAERHLAVGWAALAVDAAMGGP